MSERTKEATRERTAVVTTLQTVTNVMNAVAIANAVEDMAQSLIAAHVREMHAPDKPRWMTPEVAQALAPEWPTRGQIKFEMQAATNDEDAKAAAILALFAPFKPGAR